MVRLSREIVAHLVQEYGHDEVLRRLPDPHWRAAVNKANIDRSERVKALKRLVEYGKEKIASRNG